MLLTDGMKTNDNEPTTFFPLAAATARVLRLYEKQNEQPACDGERSHRNKQHESYVNQRLRDYAAFERRITGRN